MDPQKAVEKLQNLSNTIQQLLAKKESAEEQREDAKATLEELGWDGEEDVSDFVAGIEEEAAQKLDELEEQVSDTKAALNAVEEDTDREETI